ncbi:MAG: ribonuclease H [bacterium]|nr:ribonuclease H [bacterium]
MNTTYALYTDGSCLGNPGPGGTGVHIIFSGEFGEKEVRDLRGYHQTTNNRMEMRAAIAGLRLVRNLKKDFGWGRVEWFTDSQYVANNIYSVKSWRKGNVWTTNNGEPILNVDLWRDLEAVRSSLGIYPSWISCEENKVADNLAKKGAKNPTHKDLGFNPGRVGASLGGKKYAPIYYQENNKELRIRIYKGDGQVSKTSAVCKIRFEIIDKDGNISEDKYYAYTSVEVYSELHRHHKYVVVTENGNILEILETD